jgi:transposase
MDNTIPFNRNGQLYLPLDLPIKFDFSPECYAMLQLLDNLDYSKFEEKQSKLGRPNAASAKVMVELIIYARLIGHYSCRSMKYLKTDLCALWLLDGKSLPDHSTFSRFIDKHKDDIQDLFYQMINRLYELNEITGETIYQDGTKVESVANKYTFVWRKALTKNMEKCFNHLKALHKEFLTLYPNTSCPNKLTEENTLSTMIAIRRFLRTLFVGIDEARHGRGIKSTKEERLFRDIEKYVSKWINYIENNEIFSEKNNPTNRNSYSKTDRSATFMRVKEDHMKNAQLKPAYNIQHLVDSNYIITILCSSDRTDFHTCVPALEKLKRNTSIEYKNYCADAGYDCKENYEYLEKQNIKSFIKPTNYEQNKKRKNKNDPSRRSNMKYIENIDAYECTQGKYIIRRKDLEEKRASNSRKRGYKPKTEQRIYKSFSGCTTCPIRNACMKSSAKRNDFKMMYVDTQLDIYRIETKKNIESDEGKIIRVNRSIQAEGSFALIKDGLSKRRFKTKSYKSVETEWLLFCMSANIVRFKNRLAQGLVGTPFEYQCNPDIEEIPKAI